MKKLLTIATLLFGIHCFSQSIKDYKAVLIPLKYDFQKEQNQFRLQTLIKYNLEKAGFQAFYSNESIPSELNDRCKLLTLDLIKESTFLVTKLVVVFKDCYGLEILKSGIGKSREKQFEEAYKEALDNAFKTIDTIDNSNSVVSSNSETTPLEVSFQIPIKGSDESKKVLERIENNLLYAQATSYGYQLIDSEPKVILKVYKTSNPTCFIATKGTVQGVLVARENQWFFEYYQNDKLISEQITVRF